MTIRLDRISKHFGPVAALRAIDLTIEEGELLALLGPSGSGKTTLLRILAGLEYPDADDGRVLFDDVDVTRATPGERRIGLVFQHYALFKHLTVVDNVAFGLTLRRNAAGRRRAEVYERAHKLLARVQLDGFADRYPSQLSGGQRQRVGLARALAIEPRVLLLDEPFGSLDAQVRRDLRRWLRGLLEELKITSVFVTHDQEEALEIADRIAVMHEGTIRQVGKPDQVYDHPVSAFVYEFFGDANVLDPDGGGSPLRTYVRPHEIELLPQQNGSDARPVTVLEVHVIGPTVRVLLRQRGAAPRIEAHVTRQQLAALGLKRGDHLFARPLNAKTFPVSRAGS